MKRLLIGGTILAAGLGTLSAASAAPSVYKVTGGGQIIASTQTGGGPGATLAFTAQGNGGAARGQLQYNDHTGQKFHGQVTCLTVLTNDDGVRVARLSGTYAVAGGTTQAFQLYVEDRDFGGPQNGTELLLFEATEDTSVSCVEEDEEASQELGRGNITIHKVKS